MRRILRSWEEIEGFSRLSRWTWRRWQRLYPGRVPIVPGWGRRPPLAAAAAVEEFLIWLAKEGGKK